MRNDILQHIYNQVGLSIYSEILGDIDFKHINYLELKDAFELLKPAVFIDSHGFAYSYLELKDLCEKDPSLQDLYNGLSGFEVFISNQVVLIENFLLDLDLMYISIKDQLIDMSKQNTLSTILPKLSNAIFLAKKLSTHLEVFDSFVKECIVLVRKNCDSYSYMENFMGNGLSNQELSLLDSNY